MFRRRVSARRFLRRRRRNRRRCCRRGTVRSCSYVVEEAKAAGIERIVIVTGAEKTRSRTTRPPRSSSRRCSRSAARRTSSRSCVRFPTYPAGLRHDRSRRSASGTRSSRRRSSSQRAVRRHARRRHRRLPRAVHRADDAALEERGNPVIAIQEVAREETRSTASSRECGRASGSSGFRWREAGARECAVRHSRYGTIHPSPEIFGILEETRSARAGDPDSPRGSRPFSSAVRSTDTLSKEPRYDDGDSSGHEGDGRVSVEARGPGRAFPAVPEGLEAR